MSILKTIDNFLKQNNNKIIFIAIIIFLFLICRKQITGEVILKEYYYQKLK